MIAAIEYHVSLSRNGYTNRRGLRQVVINIYQQGARRTVNTHIHVSADDFSNGRIQPTCDNHDLLNRRIRRILRRLMELEDEMLDHGREPTPQRLVEAYQNNLTPSATIAEWISSVISPSNRQQVTKNNYRTVLTTLEAFMPGLRLRQLNYDLLQRWQDWMRNERHLSPNTIAIRMKTLRCLVNEAIKRDVLKPEEDPFRKIRIPEITARREHLTEAELNTLERYHTNDARLAHIRDAFLFCCYTGLRWGDFRRLTNDNIATAASPTLTLRQHKTGHPLILPLDRLWSGKPWAIVSRYTTLQQLAAIGDNQQCNRDLRRIGQEAGLQKHLHWHLARHTCGTLLNQHGLRMQEIQYILGHQRQTTTERHYAETTLQQVQQALQQAFAEPQPSPTPITNNIVATMPLST